MFYVPICWVRTPPPPREIKRSLLNYSRGWLRAELEAVAARPKNHGAAS